MKLNADDWIIILMVIICLAAAIAIGRLAIRQPERPAYSESMA